MPPSLAFRCTFFSSFSRSWTWPRGLYFLHRDSTTSLRSFRNCIGWQPQSGFSSSSLFSCTSVSKGRQRRTLPMSSSARPIPRPRDGYAPLHHRWLSVAHGCPLSAIGLSSCRCPYLEQTASTSHVRTLCLYFEDAWGSPFQAFLSLTSYHNSCSACAVTVVIFIYFKRSFYLLTYLLMYVPNQITNKLLAQIAIQLNFIPVSLQYPHLTYRQTWRSRNCDTALSPDPSSSADPTVSHSSRKVVSAHLREHLLVSCHKIPVNMPHSTPCTTVQTCILYISRRKLNCLLTLLPSDNYLP